MQTMMRPTRKGNDTSHINAFEDNYHGRQAVGDKVDDEDNETDKRLRRKIRH